LSCIYSSFFGRFTTYVPECWQEADNGDLVAGPSTFGSSGWGSDGFGNVGTTGAFDYNLYTTGANDWILSPLYAIPAAGYELKFDAAAVQFSVQTSPTTPWEEDDFVEVLVSTGIANWIVLYTYTSTNVPSNTGSSNIIDSDAYSGQNVRFAFRAVEGNSNGGADIEFSVDNFEIRMTPSCVEPTILTATNITPNSADLGWTENGTATVWDIEWDTAGFTPTGTPNINDASDNPYTLSSLTPQMDYEFYVRADCGSDNTDVSAWSGPFAFRTLCAAISTPYTEDFETFAVSSSEFSEQNCWTATNIGGYLWEVAATTDTSSSGTGPGAGVSDGNYLFTEATSGSTGDAIDLTSPLVDLSGLTVPSLSFDYHMFGGDMGTLDVIVRSGGTDTTVFTLSGQQQTSETEPFITQTIDLSAYTGQTIQVTFRGTKGADFESDMAVDTVVFDESPSCLSPSALTATNITSTSADLGWTENGTATVWDIEWGTAGFTPTGTPNVNDTSDNPYLLVGLMADTSYEFYVRADCGMDNTDVSNWSGPYSFYTGYCVPSGTSSSSYIDSFSTTGGATNITNNSSGFSTGNYGDFSSSMSVSLAQDQAFNFNITIVGGTVGSAIWIDWNQDFIFDISEVAYSTTSYGDGPFTGTVTVPNAIADGVYKMRVMIDWNDSNPGDDAACSYGSGREETEDYSIIVDATLSTSDFENENAFSYFPNPVKDELTLRAQSMIQNVSIYNLLGQEVLRTTPNAIETDVNMSELQTGAYFVKVTINDSIETIRIIKQ